MVHYAIVAQVGLDKKEEKRSRQQQNLVDIVTYINNYYQEDFLTPFQADLSSGCFEGVLLRCHHLLEILDIIQFRFTSADVYFGIGMGKEEEAKQIAFSSLQELMAHSDYGSSKILIGANDQLTWLPLVNENLHVCDYIQGRWKSLQRMIMEMTVLKSGYNTPPKQTELADLFKTSKQNINRAIRQMGYHQYLRAKKECQCLLNQYGE